MSAQDQEFDLHHVTEVLLKRAWLIVGLTVGAFVLTYLLVNRSTDIYEATSQVQIITDPNADSTFGQTNIRVDAKRDIDTQIQVIKSNKLEQKVNDSLGADAGLVTKVTVTPVAETDTVQIAVQSPSPLVAQTAANLYANLFAQTRREQAVKNLDDKAGELNNKVKELGDQIAEIDGRLAETPNADLLKSQRASLVSQQDELRKRATEFEIESALRKGNVEVINDAHLPKQPVAPRPLRDATFVALLMALFAIALSFLLERLDDRLAGPEDIAKLDGSPPVLGSIPIYQPSKKRGARKLPHGARTLVPLNSIDAEVYRTLRTNLRFSNLGKAKKIIMITSASGSEGKSTVTANLAISLAESGQRVVIVSADLRRPVISSIFDIRESNKGLTSVLVGDASLNECLIPVTLESGRKLFMLPAGPLPHNPAELLGSMAMNEVLQGLARADVDFVLVDCPPVLPVSDPLAIAQFVDGVILISVIGQTRRRHLNEAYDRLTKVGADIIGVVLNGVPTAGGRYPFYYYRRYPTYEQDADAGERGRSATPPPANGSSSSPAQPVVTPSRDG